MRKFTKIQGKQAQVHSQLQQENCCKMLLLHSEQGPWPHDSVWLMLRRLQLFATTFIIDHFLLSFDYLHFLTLQLNKRLPITYVCSSLCNLIHFIDYVNPFPIGMFLTNQPIGRGLPALKVIKGIFRKKQQISLSTLNIRFSGRGWQKGPPSGNRVKHIEYEGIFVRKKRGEITFLNCKKVILNHI